MHAQHACVRLRVPRGEWAGRRMCEEVCVCVCVCVCVQITVGVAVGVTTLATGTALSKCVHSHTHHTCAQYTCSSYAQRMTS